MWTPAQVVDNQKTNMGDSGTFFTCFIIIPRISPQRLIFLFYSQVKILFLKRRLVDRT